MTTDKLVSCYLSHVGNYLNKAAHDLPFIEKVEEVSGGQRRSGVEIPNVIW